MHVKSDLCCSGRPRGMMLSVKQNKKEWWILIFSRSQNLSWKTINSQMFGNRRCRFRHSWIKLKNKNWFEPLKQILNIKKFKRRLAKYRFVTNIIWILFSKKENWKTKKSFCAKLITYLVMWKGCISEQSIPGVVVLLQWRGLRTEALGAHHTGFANTYQSRTFYKKYEQSQTTIIKIVFMLLVTGI